MSVIFVQENEQSYEVEDLKIQTWYRYWLCTYDQYENLCYRDRAVTVADYAGTKVGSFPKFRDMALMGAELRLLGHF
eukprot:944135-Rhodomonas_salina.5